MIVNVKQRVSSAGILCFAALLGAAAPVVAQVESAQAEKQQSLKWLEDNLASVGTTPLSYERPGHERRILESVVARNCTLTYVVRRFSEYYHGKRAPWNSPTRDYIARHEYTVKLSDVDPASVRTVGDRSETKTFSIQAQTTLQKPSILEQMWFEIFDGRRDSDREVKRIHRELHITAYGDPTAAEQLRSHLERAVYACGGRVDPW